MSDRLFGALLTWLSDHKSDVFFVGTANDVSRLAAASQGAFSRAERFDALFFMDLPSKEQRSAIWQIYLPYFKLAENSERPSDDGWTGAEIKACCRLASLLDTNLKEAASLIVPVSATSREQVSALRDWAHKRCLSADWRGVYDKQGEPKYLKAEDIRQPRRRVVTASSIRTGTGGTAAA